MKKILFAAITALMLVSCAKEQACETSNIGYIAVENKTTWTINVTFSDQQHQIQPNEVKTISAFAGDYDFYAVAVTTPTVEWDLAFRINPCHTLPVTLDY